MSSIREIWKELPPEQKELVFLGIHGAVSGLIISAFRKAQIPLINIIKQRPGLILGGILLGGIYYNIVKKFVIGEES